jgi:c-di-GMP-binding flagellar brake protein YcgR
MGGGETTPVYSKQRAFVRYKCQLQTQARFLYGHRLGQPVRATITEISGGGCRVRFDDEPSLRQNLELSFEPAHGESVRLMARPIWTQRGDSFWELAVQFLGVDRKTERALVRLVISLGKAIHRP